MNSLIINTSNKVLDIVLQKEGQVFSSSSSNDAHHNEVLIPMIDNLLSANNVTVNDIDRFGVVVGPGSFTGIRVGVATIKAFRDVTKASAYGINNLDLLFALATNQFDEVEAVAIAGSGNTYFVARLVNNVVYKYDRNLTLAELKEIAPNGKIAMFEEDKNIKALVVKFDANIIIDCLNKSKDQTLTPVYYQLSQAEREKLKAGNLTITKADEDGLNKIAEIEKQVSTSPLTLSQIEEMLKDKNYQIHTACFNGEIVGFIILQITDEVNIISVAVDKDYRNLGIASKLIDKAQEECKKHKIKNLTLEVGYKNITAYLLYKKLGFVVRRTRKNYYANGDDCLEMIKEV